MQVPAASSSLLQPVTPIPTLTLDSWVSPMPSLPVSFLTWSLPLPLPLSLSLPLLSSDTPQASSRDAGLLVWGAVGGTLLVLLLLAGGSLAFILLRVRRRKSPGGGGGGDRGSYDPKTQALGNGGPVFWTPTSPASTRPDGKDEEEEDEDEEAKAEEGLMLPPSPALKDDMESHLDGSLISRRAVYV